ncbi:hydrolase, partial [Thioclava sp. BHET1]
MTDLAALRAGLEAALDRHDDADDPAHDRAHIHRVWANACRIARGEGVSPDAALMGAAWLHDLVNLPKDHPERHQASTRSATAARPILAALGLSAQEVGGAVHAIAAHSFSAGIAPETMTAR